MKALQIQGQKSKMVKLEEHTEIRDVVKVEKQKYRSYSV